MGLDYSKPVYEWTYTSGARRIYAGEKLVMGQNIGSSSYFEPTRLFCDLLKGSQLSAPGPASGPNSNGYYDATTEAWSQLLHSNGVFIHDGTYIMLWRGTGDASWNTSGSYVSAGAETNYLVDGQTQADYNGAAGDADTLQNGSFTQGSGYNASETATFKGVVVTFNTVGGSGEVLTFTVDSSAQNADSVIGATETPIGGSGSGFTLTPQEASVQHRKEYIVTGNIPDASGSFRVTGGTCKEAAVIQPGQEARWRAGNFYHQQFVDDNIGLGVMRPLGLAEINNSIVRDYSDIITTDHVSWTYTSTQKSPGYPAIAMARLAVECNCDIWWNVYHQMTDAAITSYATVLEANLPPGRMIWVELSNEVWNFGAFFADQFKWVGRADAPTREATVDPLTGICTDPGHNLINGEIITMFNNVTHERVFPYSGGGSKNIQVLSANTFRLSDSSTLVSNATQSNPCVVSLFGNSLDIKDVFRENPCRIVVEDYEQGHGIQTGDKVFLQNTGVSQLDGNVYTVTIPGGASVTFTLDGIDATSYDPHTRGDGDMLTAHTLTNGQSVTFEDVGGMVELNGNSYTVANAAEFTIELQGINSTGYGAYTSGGVALEPITNLENVGSPIPADITFIRYKQDRLSVLDNDDNYAIESVRVWDAAQAVLGDKMYRVGSGQRTNVGLTLSHISNPEFRRKLDAYSAASYIRCNGSTVGDFDHVGATEAEINAYFRDTEMPGVQAQMDAHIQVLGHSRFINYENGDHNDSVDIELLSWARSITGVTPIYYEWYPLLTDIGVHMCCHLTYCNDYTASTFGQREFPGENSAKQQGVQDYYDQGGAPASEGA